MGRHDFHTVSSQQYPPFLFLNLAFIGAKLSPHFLSIMSKKVWLQHTTLLQSRYSLILGLINTKSFNLVTRHEVQASVAQTRTLKEGGHLIRFNSSPVSRHCFYVFCKYLFSRRYVLHDAIFSLEWKQLCFLDISVFILNYFKLALNAKKGNKSP